MAVPKKKTDAKLRENEKKWGKPLVKAGWTLLPSTILEHQQELGLDPVDLNILLQLARHWWKAGEPPYPSIASIADCIGRSVSAVQRRLKAMEKRGLIAIKHRYDPSHGGQTSSYYHFTGLIEDATHLAKDALEKRQQQRTRQGRGSRPKKATPNLRVHRNE